MKSPSRTDSPALPTLPAALEARLPDELLVRGRELAGLLTPLGLHADIATAALLYPALLAGAIRLDELPGSVNTSVQELLEEAARLPIMDANLLDADHPDPRAQTENIRQMLLTFVRDIRTLLLKLGEELLKLRELKHASAEEQKLAARLVLNIHAPLANRLGIWQLKWELEDLAFRYAQPEEYKRIARALSERRVERDEYIKRVVDELDTLLRTQGIVADIKGRPKHIYSIWKKMQKKSVDVDALFDLRAIRVLVDSVQDCYAVLGLVHGHWRHVPREFDDYIATPKGNDYQSLHTAVIGPESRTVEIQIRTWQMHDHAELGVAAHWRYKEGHSRKLGESGLSARISWLRQLLEKGSEDDFIHRFQDEVFQDRIYVLTPKGAVIDLPVNATPLDFAYHVHTEVGHRCRGAKVNGKMVPLTTPLVTGDRVEILTARQGTPSRDWLNPQSGYLVSSRGRDKVRYWFRQQSHETNLQLGEQMFENELLAMGIENISADEVARLLKLPDSAALFLALGAGDISIHQISNILQKLIGTPEPSIETFRSRQRPPKTGKFLVDGESGLLSQTAQCCQPLPPDPIRGYITRGRGISIHRADCEQLMNLENNEPNRVIDVEWSDTSQRRYVADIHIEAHDRNGLLRDITGLLTEMKINILGMNARHTEEPHTVSVELGIEVTGLEELSRTLNRLNALPGIYSARRKQG